MLWRLFLLAFFASVPSAVPIPDELDDTEFWPAEGDAQDDSRHLLDGVVLDGLIDYSGLSLEVEAVGLEGAYADTTLPAGLHGAGTVSHPFEGDVVGLSFSLGLFAPASAKQISERLTKPPLRLTQAELNAPFPTPWASLSEPVAVSEEIEAGVTSDLVFERDLGEVTFLEGRLPSFLLSTTAYELRFPSSGDITMILERGGAADHAALLNWARDQDGVPSQMTEDERREVMSAVLGRLRRMRSPPALGDLQRLLALDALIRAFAGRDELEPLLRSQRAISILHSGSVLAYDSNAREEAVLGMPVHGTPTLPTRSEFLGAPEMALKSLRTSALDRLLELAFDPVDFRDAPADGNFTKSRLHAQANELLGPLAPTDVSRVLKLTDAHPKVQARILRYYIDVHHAPVVGPLVDWLLANPSQSESLGLAAAEAIPDALLPTAMQRFVDPEDPEHRATMRALITAMPERLGPQVLESLRLVGMDVHQLTADKSNIGAALDAYEVVERKLAADRARLLVEQVRENGSDEATLRGSVRAIARLAQVDPQIIVNNEELFTEVLVEAAWEYEVESPADSRRALDYLTSLPWGEAATRAEFAQKLLQARLANRRGESREAILQVQEIDPELDHEVARELFVDAVGKLLEQQLASADFVGFDKTLQLASSMAADSFDIGELERRVFWRRYRAAVFVAVGFGLLLLGASTWLTVRAIRRLIAGRKMDIDDDERLRRRREDADANALDAAEFNADDHEVAAPAASEVRAHDIQADPIPESETAAADDATRKDSSAPPEHDAEPDPAPANSRVDEDPIRSEVNDAFPERGLDDDFGDPFDDDFGDPFDDEFVDGRDEPGPADPQEADLAAS